PFGSVQMGHRLRLRSGRSGPTLPILSSSCAGKPTSSATWRSGPAQTPVPPSSTGTSVKRLALLLLFLAPSASGYELLDRVQIREKAVGKDEYGRTKYAVVASMAPLRYFHAPLMQVYPLGGGGGS